jgi:hypothetical protein
MLPTPVSYTLWPSVILADATTSMTVTAAERAYIIPDGKEFTVNVISVNSDENYYAPKNKKSLAVSGKNGALTFDFVLRERESTLFSLYMTKRLFRHLLYIW